MITFSLQDVLPGFSGATVSYEKQLGAKQVRDGDLIKLMMVIKSYKWLDGSVPKSVKSLSDG